MIEKYAIPAGIDFAAEIAAKSAASSFFAWLIHNKVDPQIIDPAKPVFLTESNGAWALAASLTDGGNGTWPLGTPTAPIINWLREKFWLKPIPMDGYQDRIDKLRSARDRAAAAKEEAEELRSELLGILAGQRASIGTVGGVPVIGIKKVPQKGKLNRAGLEKDHPEIVAQYVGPDTEQTQLVYL